ncbi:MAG: GNAT family N-acetyltransferase, partial [Asticcacaulis sp.]|nr:GNAT family N-acetyltransferase [Asticcacaulis sp.]
MPVLDLADGYYELAKGKLANLVTCLEMLAPPARTLAPFPVGLELERVDPGDLVAYRDLFRAVGADWMWTSRLLMPDDKLAQTLSDPARDSFRLTADGETSGILELYFETSEICELAFFGLVPGAIGKGLGRALMDEALRRAWSRGIRRLWVHTCTFDSPDALPFYIRSGFTPYARMVEFH